MLDWFLDADAIRERRAALLASARRGDREEVARTEALVRADPSHIVFDADGAARIDVPGRTYAAGRFETPTLGELEARAAARGPAGPARSRLAAVLGVHPLTDIGALQAVAEPDTLFQVASQFNCLEAPAAHQTPVGDYFRDSTQGPRASISAFPGTLVRHYAAPRPDGTRFVQHGTDQIDLLADAVPRSTAQVTSGYLKGSGVVDAAGLARSLENGFEQIRIGVHDDVQVVLGYNWDGAVDGDRRIAQVFTSTFALGYSDHGALARHEETVCRQLLWAAYLGTLLAAQSLGKRTVVLTAIGGGVFANPHPLIWGAILWAFDRATRTGPERLDVFFNGRGFGVPAQQLRADTEARGGFLAELPAST